MAKERKRKSVNKPLSRTPRTPRTVRTVSTADESREMLLGWWQENGKYFVGGAVLGILAIGGWQGWHYYMDRQAMGAAVHYSEMSDYIALGEAQDAHQILDTLQEQYTATAYSSLASFIMAKLRIEQGQLEAAADDLRWITKHSQHEEIRALAWVRLARVLLELGHKEEAYDIVLSRSFPNGIEQLAAEARGDYLAQEGNRSTAIEAYKESVSASMPDEYNFITMKRKELSGK